VFERKVDNRLCLFPKRGHHIRFDLNPTTGNSAISNGAITDLVAVRGDPTPEMVDLRAVFGPDSEPQRFLFIPRGRLYRLESKGIF
jgi:hypothetical protein